MTFAQFIAVHVNHISVVLVNRSREPSWFLHATVAEIHLDGSIVQNAKSLIVTAALNEAEVCVNRSTVMFVLRHLKGFVLLVCFFLLQAKILRYYPPDTDVVPSPPTKPDVCLVELSFGVAFDAVLIALGQPSLEKIQLNMNHTKTTVHDGLYDFIRDTKSAKNRSTTPPGSLPTIVLNKGAPPLWDGADLYARISPIIPKVFFFNIHFFIEFV